MSHATRLRLSAFGAASLLVTCAARPLAAQESTRSDTLAGRVTSTVANAPVSGAVIFVTRGPDRLVKQDTATADGRWRVTFTPGTGDYLVFISAPGAVSFRTRVTRTGSEQLFIVDAQLNTGAATQLAAVRVQAQAPRPDRTDRTGALPTVGSNERIAEGVYGAVSPTAAGNPLATAATIPGLNVGAGGITALGAGGDQSLTTLNGLASGASLPREARTRTRASLSSYDPAVGGFSGALVQQELEPGREDTERRSSFTLDAPALRSGDALARAYGLRPSTFQVSGALTGALDDARLYYATAAQLSHRSASQSSLLTSPASVLALDGLDAADVTRVQRDLLTVGVPSGRSSLSTVVDQLKLVGQIDRTPRALHAIRVTGVLDAHQTTGADLSPVSLPGVGSRERAVTAAVQFGMVAFLGTRRPVQNDFRTSVSVQATSRAARTPLPAGLVRVPDLVAGVNDPSTAVPTLRFGGFNGLTGDRANMTWEVADDFSWLRGGRKHLFKLHAWSRIDALRDETTTDALGSFSYNTLDDFTSGRPASYTRTLSQPTRAGATWNAATAFAHRWAPSRVFQLMWGARLEANTFLGSPDRNGALESALGLRTDNAPSAIAFSPRVGMTWYLVRDAAGGTMTQASDLARRSSLPVGMIRAGVGEFRGLYRADAMTNADGATGLANAFRRLTCIGAGTPSTDWVTYGIGGGPTQCAAGAPALGDAAPAVSILGPKYQPPRNWRASAGWTSRFAKVDYRVDATYALNLRQGSVLDRNLRTLPAFTLASEHGRQVYVPVTSIDASSGGVSATASRLAPAFGPVMERVGDLRGYARNLTLSLTPDLNVQGAGDAYLNLNYTWASARAASRGFDGGTGGDPRAIEWARSPYDIRHQVIAQFARTLPRDVGLSVFLSLQSGLPFTPLVAGDINGDGLANDRAFIPGAGPPALDALLAGAPKAVARCLTAQRGRIAGRNSCEGPWSQSMQVRLDAPGRAIGLPRRARLALQFANPLGALDRALHGSDGLRGWGSGSEPNPVLLIPRGFDGTTKGFRYDVNPRFGETRPSRIARPLDPYGITLDVQLSLSVDPEVQELRRQMKPGRAGDRRPKLSADSLMARYQRSMPSLYVGLQALSDTLLLSPVQIDSLALFERRYRATLDSVYRPLVAYLAELPDRYDGAAALTQVQAVDSLAWEATYAVGPRARATLSPLQMTVLPEFVRRLLNDPLDLMRRTHTRYELDVTPQGASYSMYRR